MLLWKRLMNGAGQNGNLFCKTCQGWGEKDTQKFSRNHLRMSKNSFEVDNMKSAVLLNRKNWSVFFQCSSLKAQLLGTDEPAKHSLHRELEISELCTPWLGYMHIGDAMVPHYITNPPHWMWQWGSDTEQCNGSRNNPYLGSVRHFSNEFSRDRRQKGLLS